MREVDVTAEKDRLFPTAAIIGATGFVVLCSLYLDPPAQRLIASNAGRMVFGLLPLVSVIVSIWKVRLTTLDMRRGWIYVATSLALWCCGTISQSIWQSLGHAAHSFPSFADVFYVCAYAFALVGAIKISAAKAATHGLDGLSIAASIMFMLWIPVFGPLIHRYDPLRAGLAMFYPLTDIVIITVTFLGVFRGVASRRGMNLLMACALSFESMGDLAYTAMNSPVIAGATSEIAEYLTCLFVILAALYPVREAKASAIYRPKATNSYVLLPYVPTVASGLVGGIMQLSRQHFDSTQVALGGVIVITLILRQLLALLANGRMARELEYLAYNDPLTGLGNRRMLRFAVEAIAHDAPHPMAVVLMDLDDFKVVNDTLGHDVGDMLLVEVGERLRKGVRATDIVVRLGGDEFAILLPHGDKDQAAGIARRVQTFFAEPVVIGGRTLQIAASIGVAPSRSDVAFDALLKHADLAMYNGKRSGKGKLIVFEDFMTSDAEEELTLHLAN